MELDNDYDYLIGQVLIKLGRDIILSYTIMLEVLSQVINKQATYVHSYPTKRSDSNSPKCFNPQELKQKSELCRSFVELGFCPYHKRCKFAHGLHQLLKNQQANIKYKTKQCDNFKKNLCCGYGTRCNFIHNHNRCIESTQQAKSDVVLKLVKANTCTRSRLIQLLERSQN